MQCEISLWPSKQLFFSSLALLDQLNLRVILAGSNTLTLPGGPHPSCAHSRTFLRNSFCSLLCGSLLILPGPVQALCRSSHSAHRPAASSFITSLSSAPGVTRQQWPPAHLPSLPLPLAPLQQTQTPSKEASNLAGISWEVNAQPQTKPSSVNSREEGGSQEISLQAGQPLCLSANLLTQL